MAASPWTDYGTLRALKGAPAVSYDGGDLSFPITERMRTFAIGKVPDYSSAEPDATRFPSCVLIEKREVSNDGHKVEAYLRYAKLPGKATTFDMWDNEVQTRVYSDHYMDLSTATLPAIGDTYKGKFVLDARKSPLGNSPLSEVVIEYAGQPANFIEFIETSVNWPGHFEPLRSGHYYVWQQNDDGTFSSVDLAALVTSIGKELRVLYPVNFSGPPGVSIRDILVRPGINVDILTPRARLTTARRTRIFLSSATAMDTLVRQLPKRLNVIAPGAASRILGSWISENTVHPAFSVYLVDMRGNYQTLKLEEFEQSDPPSYDPTATYCIRGQVRNWRGNVYFMDIVEATEAGSLKTTNSTRKVLVPFTVAAANYLDNLRELGGVENGFLLYASSAGASDGGTKRLRIAGRKIGQGTTQPTVNPVATELLTLSSTPDARQQTANRWWRLFGVQLVDSAGEPTNAAAKITVGIDVAKGSENIEVQLACTGTGAIGDTLTVSRVEGSSTDAVTYTWGTIATEVTRLRIREGSAELPAGGVGTPVDPAALALSDAATRYALVIYRSDVGEWDNGENYYTGALPAGVDTAHAIEVAVTSSRTASQLRDDIKSVVDGSYSAKWTTASSDTGDPIVDSTGNVGSFCSLAVVNGFPGIAYNDTTNHKLKFALNAAADGSGVWTLTTADAVSGAGLYNSLCVVNGNPAIAYWKSVIGKALAYVRATNASGTAWATPVDVDTSTTAILSPSLCVVNGNPAIAYFDAIGLNLKYVRASDASGTAWGSPVNIDTVGDVGDYTSLCVVNGNPAIAYYDRTNGNLKYVRASNASGTAWGSPVNVDTGGDVGGAFNNSLVVVAGKPCIAYYDTTNGNLKYVRASDESGAAWNTPVTVASADDIGKTPSLCVVNGRPAIAYYDTTNTQLMFVRATDTTGAAWGTPAVIDTDGDQGQYASLAIIDGNPAVAYYDNTLGNLMFRRNTAADGADPWARAYYLTLTQVAPGTATDAALSALGGWDAAVSTTTQGGGSAANTIAWSATAANKATALAAVLNNPTTAIAAGYASAGSSTLAAITAGTVTAAVVSTTKVYLTEPFRAEVDWLGTTETGASVDITFTGATYAGTSVATIAAGTTSAYLAFTLENDDYKAHNLPPRVEVETDPIGVGSTEGLLGSTSWRIGMGTTLDHPVKLTYQVSANLTDWVDGVGEANGPDAPFYVQPNGTMTHAVKLFTPREMTTHTFGLETRTTKYVKLKLTAKSASQFAAVNAFVELAFPS